MTRCDLERLSYLSCWRPAWLKRRRPSPKRPDKVRFGTNWVAEAEHGGFYQALADGTYKKYGLDVTIVPGGPNVNNRILLPVGKLDFFMSANSLQSFDAVEHDIPTIAVAASFQKDPQVLIAHPGVDKLEDLKKLTLFVSKEGMVSYFQWLKADYGFDEAKVKPYTFNPQPFLADKNSAMQGYVTSEPYAIETQGHFKPKLFLIADHGFNSYSTLIETRRDLVEKQARSGAALRRCLGHRLVSLHLRRCVGRQCADQETKPGNDRRALGLFDRQDEGIRHCRFRRLGQARHRRHDRRAHEELLRQDGARRRGQGRARLSQGLYDALRQQRRRRRSAAKMSSAGADIVTLRNVGKTYDSGTVALDGFNLAVGGGEFVSLLGPSGCGKSTALRIVAGLSAPSAGAVEWPGAVPQSASASCSRSRR